MKVLSLFDGISCGMVALERAGIPVERYVAYEIEENAIRISKKNYPQIEHCGDVSAADFTQYRGFDAIFAGFPCQDLSINKANRQGLKGKRSGLFWHLVRAIKEVKPKYFLVENNWKMPGEDLQIITRELGVEPILCNSAEVSPQQRYRLIWTNIPVKLPFPKKDIVVAEADEERTSVENSNIDFGIKRQQFSSEKILEDELTVRIESGMPVFGLNLKIYNHKGDFYGRQYPFPYGRLDLLCENEKGDLYRRLIAGDGCFRASGI